MAVDGVPSVIRGWGRTIEDAGLHVFDECSITSVEVSRMQGSGSLKRPKGYLPSCVEDVEGVDEGEVLPYVDVTVDVLSGGVDPVRYARECHRAEATGTPRPGFTEVGPIRGLAVGAKHASRARDRMLDDESPVRRAVVAPAPGEWSHLVSRSPSNQRFDAAATSRPFHYTIKEYDRFVVRMGDLLLIDCIIEGQRFV